MKASTIFGCVFVVLLTAGGIYLLYPYLTNYTKGNEIILFIDKTDSLKGEIHAQDIVSGLELDKHIWKSNEIRVQTISNYEYNNVQELNLNGEFFFFSSPKKRKKEVKRFADSLNSVLHAIYQNDTVEIRSAIYEPIAREANRLAQSKAEQRYIIVQSDLQENTEVFSIYKNLDFDLLKRHPEKIEERLSALIQIQNLKGIEVYFVYQPRSDDDNRRFIIMSKFFKTIFEGKGAKVHIGSNLII